jgi:hypothetical protein
MHVHAHMLAHTHTHTHTHRPACTCREWQPCSGSIPGTHTHTHAHTHTHTHTYIPTHFSTQDCMRFAESSSFVQLASLAHSPTHTLTLPRRPVCVSQRAAASSRQQPWCSPPHSHTHTRTHTRTHTLTLPRRPVCASQRAAASSRQQPWRTPGWWTPLPRNPQADARRS